MSAWLYYLLVLLLLLLNVGGWLLNLAALPGNWLIVVLAAAFSTCVHHASGDGITWPVVGVLVVLAIVGEVIEFAAGTVGAARSGASRRAMMLSVVGSIIGSIVGAMVGIPIPVLGSAIAALLGGAIGAGVGAAMGEEWRGRDLDGSVQVGAAAFWGRILGTAGKIIVGAIMVVIATIDSLW